MVPSPGAHPKRCLPEEAQFPDSRSRQVGRCCLAQHACLNTSLYQLSCTSCVRPLARGHTQRLRRLESSCLVAIVVVPALSEAEHTAGFKSAGPAVSKPRFHPSLAIKIALTMAAMRTVDDVFADYVGRRRGIIKALTTEVRPSPEHPALLCVSSGSDLQPSTLQSPAWQPVQECQPVGWQPRTPACQTCAPAASWPSGQGPPRAGHC